MKYLVILILLKEWRGTKTVCPYFYILFVPFWLLFSDSFFSSLKAMLTMEEIFLLFLLVISFINEEATGFSNDEAVGASLKQP